MKYLLFILLLFFNISCGSSDPSTNMPKWTSSQPELCGVGIHKKRGNLGSDRSFSVAKGRLDLGQKLETKILSMTKFYEATGEVDEENFTEELAKSASVSLSKTIVNGSNPDKVVEDSLYVYSLVCIKPGALTEAIGNMSALSHAQKKALARRAQSAQKELSEYMENY